jgi:hypothetical protein
MIPSVVIYFYGETSEVSGVSGVSGARGLSV